MFFQDKYDLTESDKSTISTINQDIEINLGLNPYTGVPFIVGGGKVIGKVTDKNNNPINGALVSLTDNDFNPIFYTNTDISGEYNISDIPLGNYKIIAKAKGKQAKKEDNFLVVPLATLRRDFNLDDELGILGGIIVGTVIAAGLVVAGAIVAIFLGSNLVGYVVTGAAGLFAFFGLVVGGIYTMVTVAQGFTTQVTEVTAKPPNDPSNNNDNNQEEEDDLDEDPNAVATVSGIIRDKNNLPVIYGDVVLYKVELNGSLTPIDFTKTNSEGLYLFSNVPKGSFKVKATQMKIVNMS